MSAVKRKIGQGKRTERKSNRTSVLTKFELVGVLKEVMKKYDFQLSRKGRPLEGVDAFWKVVKLFTLLPAALALASNRRVSLGNLYRCFQRVRGNDKSITRKDGRKITYKKQLDVPFRYTLGRKLAALFEANPDLLKMVDDGPIEDPKKLVERTLALYDVAEEAHLFVPTKGDETDAEDDGSDKEAE